MRQTHMKTFNDKTKQHSIIRKKYDKYDNNERNFIM